MSGIYNNLRCLPSDTSNDSRDYYYFRVLNETLYPYFTSAKEAASEAFADACKNMDIEDTCEKVKYTAQQGFSFLKSSGSFVYNRGADLLKCAKWIWDAAGVVPGGQTALGALVCSSICFAVLYHRPVRITNKIEPAPIFINSAPSTPLASTNPHSYSDPYDQPTGYRRFFVENPHVMSN